MNVAHGDDHDFKRLPPEYQVVVVVVASGSKLAAVAADAA